MKRILGAVVGAVVLGAAPVQAQTASWDEVCTNPTGPNFEFRTCMAAQLTYNSGTGAVDLWVWNLGGSGGASSQGRIDAIGLAGVPWVAGGISNFNATSATGVDRDNGWDVSTNGIPGGGCCSLLFAFTQQNGQGADKRDIVSSSFVGNTSNYDVTTWGGDFNGGAGAFKFSFTVGTGLNFNPANVYLFAHIKEAAPGESDQFYCQADLGTAADFCLEPDDPGDPNEVVPEPATMTLLATGLVGLAASRRRKKNAV